MSVGANSAANAWMDEYLSSIYQRGDVLLLAAAGNDGTTAVSFPAGYTQVVSVAATAPGNARAAFSQSNADVELAAPGINTLSTLSSLGGQDSSVIGGGVVALSPPVNGDAGDDSLRSPPLTRVVGSGAGTRAGGARRCTPPAAALRCAGSLLRGVWGMQRLLVRAATKHLSHAAQARWWTAAWPSRRVRVQPATFASSRGAAPPSAQKSSTAWRAAARRRSSTAATTRAAARRWMELRCWGPAPTLTAATCRRWA